MRNPNLSLSFFCAALLCSAAAAQDVTVSGPDNAPVPAVTDQVPAIREALPAPSVAVTQLQGTVTRQAVPAATLTATIDSEAKRKFPGPPSQFVAVTLHLNNPTADSLILDGDNALASYASGGQVKNASEVQAVADASRMLTKKQKALIAAVTVATGTLGGQLFYEWIQGGSSNPKLALGPDEIRRRIEGVRLGARLLLPNETADGTLFLPAEAGMPSSITIPVLSYPARQPAGALRVDIAAAPSKP